MAKVTAKKQIQFDPSKKYEWKPDDEFTISGIQMQQIYNTLNMKMQDPVFVQHVNEYESLKMLQEVFIRGIEQGVIVEAKEKTDEDSKNLE